MKILSLFDGISIAQQALKELGIECEYYASEIDKYAISITQKNFPNTIQLGSVTELGKTVPYPQSLLDGVDLIVFGSPCTDLSIAKKNRQGLKGSASGLFYEAVRIMKDLKPKYFLMENVNSMSQDSKDEITKTLLPFQTTLKNITMKNNTQFPIMINAALVSAQNRKRLFWTNINVYPEQPADKGILLRDILQPNTEVDDRMVVKGKSFAITASYNGTVAWNSIEKKQRTMVRVGQLNQGGQGDRIYSPDGKSVNLSANGGGRGAKTGLYAVGVEKQDKKIGKEQIKSNALMARDYKGFGNQQMTGVMDKSQIRKLTPIECERLQSLTEVEQSCMIKVCLDHQNNYVNVENKNLKLQSVVGIAEKNDSKENVLSVGKNLHTNNLQTNKPAQPNVLISCGENTLQIHYQNKLLANVSGADWKQNVHHLKKIEDFVHLVVGINTIVEKTINGGEGELHQKNKNFKVVEDGKNVVTLYGKGIMQLAKDAEKDLTIHNKLSKSTILNHLSQENKEQIIQILFSYVVLAIIGYIPKKILNQNILTFQIKSKVGYTWGISNSQRYKALGNAFNCEVIKHILQSLKDK